MAVHTRRSLPLTSSSSLDAPATQRIPRAHTICHTICACVCVVRCVCARASVPVYAFMCLVLCAYARMCVCVCACMRARGAWLLVPMRRKARTDGASESLMASCITGPAVASMLISPCTVPAVQMWHSPGADVQSPGTDVHNPGADVAKSGTCLDCAEHAGGHRTTLEGAAGLDTRRRRYDPFPLGQVDLCTRVHVWCVGRWWKGGGEGRERARFESDGGGDQTEDTTREQQGAARGSR
jgi:hypothetical protein